MQIDRANPMPQLPGHAMRVGFKAAPHSPSSGLTGGSAPTSRAWKEHRPWATSQGHPELHSQMEDSASLQPCGACTVSQYDPAACKGVDMKGRFYQWGSMGSLPHLIPPQLVDRGSAPCMCPPLGSASSGSPPSLALCRPSPRNATGQTIAFLFLLLADVVDCLSCKFPELTLAGVWFDLKPLSVSTLCFPSMLPSSSPSWTAHLPKLLPHPLLVMVHVRQYFQEFHGLSLYTVPSDNPQRVWMGYFLLWLKETCPLM